MLRLLSLLVAFPLFAREPELVDEVEAEEGIELLGSAHLQFDQGLDELRANFMKDLAKAILHADRAELFLLDFEIVGELPAPQKKPDEEMWTEIEKELERDLDEEDEVEEMPIEKRYFPIVPYDCFSKILKSKTLDGDSLMSCREAVAEILNQGGIGGGALCHFPIHGVRLFMGEREVFQTSLCWKCGNYFLSFPDDRNDASWIGIGGEKMSAFCLKEMPIPQVELDRFDAIHGPKK
ncbi:hypothetical protein V2O64_01890 [Verrucomicrobiaceae bacterium 227]